MIEASEEIVGEHAAVLSQGHERRLRRKLARVLGAVLIAAGILTLAWVIVVWRWQDPFTALYTHFEQARLARAYERRAAASVPNCGRPILSRRDAGLRLKRASTRTRSRWALRSVACASADSA